MNGKASKYLTCLCCTLLTIFALEAQSAGAIIEKHLTAIGGETRLDKIQSLSLSLSLLQRGITSQIILKVFHQRGVYIEQVRLGKTSIQIANKEKAWQQGPTDEKAVEVSREKLRSAIENMNLLRTFPPLLLTDRSLVEQGVLVRKPKLERLPAGKCYVLKATPNSSSTIVYFIDHQSYRLLRRTITLTHGKFSTTEVTDYQDFRWIDHILVPFGIMHTLRGSGFFSQLKQEIQIEALALNPILADSLFTINN